MGALEAMLRCANLNAWAGRKWVNMEDFGLLWLEVVGLWKGNPGRSDGLVAL
jgi:hypothetical protein